jgi:transcriptional regulator with XRE-family HTH domain
VSNINRREALTRARGKERHVEHGRLGRNLRHLLGLHDVSQQDLARYLGLSPQGLWNILHGRSEPRSRTAHALALAFGVNLEVLFADTGTCVRAAAGVFERAPVRAIADRAAGTPPEPLISARSA